MTLIYENLVKELFKHLYTSSDLVEKANFALADKQQEISEIKDLLENKMKDGDSLAFSIYQVRYRKKIDEVSEKALKLMEEKTIDNFSKEQLANPFFELDVACIGFCLKLEKDVTYEKNEPPTLENEKTEFWRSSHCKEEEFKIINQ